MSIVIPTNQYQTAITTEWLEQFPNEVQEQFLDFIDTVPMLKYMIGERPRAKDLPRDLLGRIIVDITHPHILEDMDYFRPAAKFYQENGCYTFLKPNSNPNSEYGKWFNEEVRRCRDGYVRESDGEWIPGRLYFFLNYSPIMLNRKSETSGIYLRVEDFPDFWEGIYYRYHYREQARMLGLHCMELARRGCAKSFTIASDMNHNLLLGENSENKRRVTTILTAYLREYLAEKDGTLSKFTPMVDFCAANTEFPRLMVKRSQAEMTWIMGYKNSNGNIKGSLNSVMAVSVKDDEGKVRGKRGFIYFEEMGCHLKGTEVLMHDGSVKAVEDVVVGDSLMGDDGTPRTVQEIHHGYDMMYNVTLTNGDNQIVNSAHSIPHIVRDWYRDTDIFTTATAPELIQKDLTRGYYIPKANIKYKHKDVAIDPYLLGLWLGDGDKTWSSIASADAEIQNYIVSTFPDTKVYDLVISEKCKNFYIPAKYDFVRKLRKMGLLNNKHIPDSYIYNDESVQLPLLAGLVDTDGDYLENKHSAYFEIIQCGEHLCLLKAARRIAVNLGFRCSLRKKVAGAKTKKPFETYYVLRISGDLDRIPTKIVRKKAKPREQKYKQRRNNSWYGFKVSEYGFGEFYGFTVDGNHLFVLEDMTITHNSYKNFKEVWDNVRDSVKEGSNVFAQLIAVGTAGDKESDFSGIKTMLYNPEAYEVYALDNVFDKAGKGSSKFAYFFPSYISRAGCMDKDGNSDVVAALMEILLERYMVKQGGDAASLLSRIAQMPITPAEAILKVKSNFFPVVMLNERIRQLDMDPRAYDDVYVGTLVDVGGKVEFRATDDTPIRKWPVDNTEQGALEIFEMPCSGTIPTHRYIIGVDPVDNDQAESSSLFSCFVFDLFTDSIVAEYTGRKPFANDNYEIVRLLCIFYNATCLYEAHPYDQKVRLPDGNLIEWGDVKVGQELFAPNGKTVRVMDIPMDGYDNIYKITFADGRTVEASENHIWSVYKYSDRYRLQNLTTKQMYDAGALTNHRQKRFFVPESGAVNYKHRDVPINPYIMGLILAEGALTKFKKQNLHNKKRNYVQVSSFVEDAEFYKSVSPYVWKYIGNKGVSWHVFIDDIYSKLSSLGLIGCNSKTKFIPNLYLFNDYQTRLELLKGLMDGDGCAVHKGACVYVTASRQLADDVMLLCRSLGIKVTENSARVEMNATLTSSDKSYHCSTAYRLAIGAKIPIFKLPRKIALQHIYNPDKRGSKAQGILDRNGIADIQYVGWKRCKCVTVDAEDGLYLIGDYVTTHNCNKKGLFSYFATKRSTWMLADCPEYLRERQLVKYSMFGSAIKGVNVNASVNLFANGLIKDWLNKTYTVDVKDERGGVHQEEVPQLYRLRNRALIQELISYAPEVNTDRVSALAQVMLYREHFIVLYGGSPSANETTGDDVSDDDFFDKDWKRHLDKLGPQYKSAFDL